jgi:hypothetical protein
LTGASSAIYITMEVRSTILTPIQLSKPDNLRGNL